MAKKTSINSVLEKKISKYLSLLEKEGVKREKAFLFGSYAKDKARSYSDIDIYLLSKQFGKIFLRKK